MDQLFHQVFHNLLFKPLTLPSPGVYRDVADRDKAFEESLAELERILNEEGDEITALVMEPLVQAAAGMLVMPHGYLKRVRELTAKHDVFLIVDEVATGFGRTGKFFACEHEGVSPGFYDLIQRDYGWLFAVGRYIDYKTRIRCISWHI